MHACMHACRLQIILKKEHSDEEERVAAYVVCVCAKHCNIKDIIHNNISIVAIDIPPLPIELA
jgi:hypothetical protein